MQPFRASRLFRFSAPPLKKKRPGSEIFIWALVKNVQHFA